MRKGEDNLVVDKHKEVLWKVNKTVCTFSVGLNSYRGVAGYIRHRNFYSNKGSIEDRDKDLAFEDVKPSQQILVSRTLSLKIKYIFGVCGISSSY